MRRGESLILKNSDVATMYNLLIITHKKIIMKNLLILLLPLILISCSKEIADNKLYSNKEIQSTEGENYFKQVNIKKINKDDSFRFEKSEAQHSHRLLYLYKEIQKSTPVEWKNLHIEIKNKFDEIKSDKSYQLDKQSIIYKFYVDILSEVELEEDAIRALKYYQELLEKDNAIEWAILTNISSQLSSKNINNDSFKDYIINGASKDLVKYSILMEDIKKEENQNAINNYSIQYYQEILDDANYALSNLSPQG